MFSSATNYDSRARGRCFPRDAHQHVQPDLSSDEGQEAVSHPGTTSSTTFLLCDHAVMDRADFMSSLPCSFPRKVFSQLAVADRQFCRGDLWLCQALNTGPRRSGRYHQRMIPKGQSQQKSREIGEIKI